MALKFWHSGLVVRDLDKAIESYSALLGIGAFRKRMVTTTWCELRGKPCQMTFALAQACMGEVDVELIQADPGDNVFWEFFQTRGEGLHHLAFWVEDIQAELAFFKEKGVETLLYGETDAGRRFAYLDCSQSLGTIIQLAQQLAQ